MKHVILDTDIGGDPDDAFALLFALASPEIQIDLVVTSDEHHGHRSAFANKIMQLLQKKVPVMQGIDLGHADCCMVDNLPIGVPPKGDFLATSIELLQKYDEIYYVCVGPQSNLAALLKNAPSELHEKLIV